MSPLEPGQWKSLLAAYGTIYAAVQLLRPLRVAAAIALSDWTTQFLSHTQQRLDCSRSVAIGIQYVLGWILSLGVASLGICFASAASGVPLFADTSLF
jgi:hypothetical protein